LGSNGARAVALESTQRTGAQPVDSPTPPRGAESHAGAPDAPKRTARTAGVLRPLPAPSTDLFISAGAIVAERAARGRASRADVESILRHAAAQAGRLLVAGEVV